MYDPTGAPADIAMAVPPATVAVLTMFGYYIGDAVQAVMLIWAVALVSKQAWVFYTWIRRGGWKE